MDAPGALSSEEDKFIYATSTTSSSGPWRWIPLGVVGPFAFFLSGPLPVALLVCYLFYLRRVRFVMKNTFRGPPRGRVVALRVFSKTFPGTCSSGLSLGT